MQGDIGKIGKIGTSLMDVPGEAEHGEAIHALDAEHGEAIHALEAEHGEAIQALGVMPGTSAGATETLGEGVVAWT
jgi:hypothetical protein